MSDVWRYFFDRMFRVFLACLISGAFFLLDLHILVPCQMCRDLVCKMFGVFLAYLISGDPWSTTFWKSMAYCMFRRFEHCRFVEMFAMPNKYKDLAYASCVDFFVC